MQTRTLGRQGLTTPAMGLGCMGMAGTYGPSDNGEAIATIHRALELGVNFLDTADIYGPYTNEELVGAAIRGQRDRYIVATKFGYVRKDGTGPIVGLNGRAEYVKQCCDASLKRLGTDYIDLYYQHRVDPATPVEETFGALADLVRAGKVRFLGISEAGPDNIRRAHAVHPLTALQSEYSLWWREPELDVIPVIRELGIGLVPFSPLGRGFLSGQVRRVEDLAPDDMRRGLPRFQGENFQKNLDLADTVRQLAARKGCTPAQLALAWVLARGADVVPIPGTRVRSRLEENVAALDVTLTADELAEIERVLPVGAGVGERYTAGNPANAR